MGRFNQAVSRTDVTRSADLGTYQAQNPGGVSSVGRLAGHRTSRCVGRVTCSTSRSDLTIVVSKLELAILVS
jgi:hypothetical protein